MLMTLVEFLREHPNPTEQEVRIAISGNLCRCTGYQGIVAAALDAAQRLKAVKEAREEISTFNPPLDRNRHPVEAVRPGSRPSARDRAKRHRLLRNRPY